MNKTRSQLTEIHFEPLNLCTNPISRRSESIRMHWGRCSDDNLIAISATTTATAPSRPNYSHFHYSSTEGGPDRVPEMILERKIPSPLSRACWKMHARGDCLSGPSRLCQPLCKSVFNGSGFVSFLLWGTPGDRYKGRIYTSIRRCANITKYIYVVRTKIYCEAFHTRQVFHADLIIYLLRWESCSQQDPYMTIHEIKYAIV